MVDNKVTSEQAMPEQQNVGLTDANMTVTNDRAGIAAINVTNNHLMSDTFPSSALQAGQTAKGYVKASSLPGQSAFDISLAPSHQMHVQIGTGAYTTSVSPAVFSDGTAGAILAPGAPLTSATDFDFSFFTGSGLLPPLINGAIAANVPALLAYFASGHKAPFKISDDISITISALKFDPSAFSCTYAGVSSPNPTTTNINVILHLSQATVGGDMTIKGQSGDFQLSLTDAFVYLQAQFSTDPKIGPQVTTLKCSIGDYHGSGTVVAVLEALFPAVAALIAAGASAYRVAGAINSNVIGTFTTNINRSIIDGINSIFDTLKSSPAIGQILTAMTSPPDHEVGEAPEVQTASNVNYSTWMTNLNLQGRALSQLKLPGSHDSATYDLLPSLSQITYSDIAFLWALSAANAPADGTWPFPKEPSAEKPLYVGQPLYDFIMGTAIRSISKTGDQSILQQLEAGIRSLDLRVYWDTNVQKFCTQHALRGPTFDDILAQIATFLQNHPSSSELIFVTISHTNLKTFPDKMPLLTNLISASIPAENRFWQATPANSHQFDFQSLGPRLLGSITNGKPTVMFMNGDWDEYSYADTITNTAGFAGVPWNGEVYSFMDLVTQQGRGLTNHTQPLWEVDWVLGANTTTIVQTILTWLKGGQSYALQPIATNANGQISSFLFKTPGAFNLFTTDWFNYSSGKDVVSVIVGMNQ